MDPTEHFIFEVELTDEDSFFDITSRNMNNSLEWDPNISEIDRKSIMLLASIIRRTHGEICGILKYEKEPELDKQPIKA